MTTTDSTTTPARAPGTVPALVLPLDLALIRWAVVCQSWADLAAGSAPLLSAFLAGWCCRCIGASQPADLGQFRDSFRVGWREADQQVEIEARQNAEHETQAVASRAPCSCSAAGYDPECKWEGHHHAG